MCASATSTLPLLRVVAIGDELLEGHTLDTNTRELVQALRELGLTVDHARTVRDRETDLLELARWHGLTISTGGLGPTRDDRTRQILADAFGVQLVEDPERWQQIVEWFARFGRLPGELEHSQALRPVPGESLRNEVGTANGLVFEEESRTWIALPGVPGEMRHLLQERLLPWLRERYALPEPGRTLNFRSRRIGEAVLHERLQPLADLEALAELGFYPHPDGVILRAKLPALPLMEVERRVTQIRELVRARLGDHLLLEDGEGLHLVLHRLLKEAGARVAVAESCTGGLLASLLTEMAGSSESLLGGVVAYANEIKECVLGVSPQTLEQHGAVSAECVKKMAAGVRKLYHADLSLSVSGVAGPGGGTEEKPVGTVWLGLDVSPRLAQWLHQQGLRVPQTPCARLERLPGNRQQVRRRSAGRALAFGVEVLLGLPPVEPAVDPQHEKALRDSRSAEADGIRE